MKMRLEARDENRLPAPAEVCSIGHARFCLADLARKERFAKSGHRQFEVQVWYPGERTVNATRKKYLDRYSVSDLVFLNCRVGPDKVRRLIQGMYTNAWNDVPLSDARGVYPVVFFSHDLAMLPEYHTMLMEHLAHAGYVVFAINHPFLSECFVKPDRKEKIGFKKNIGLQWLVSLLKSRKLFNAKSYVERWALAKAVLPSFSRLADFHADMARDQRFLLDFLCEMSAKHRYDKFPFAALAGRLDLRQVGVVGHGWGGAAGVMALTEDHRIGAAVNLDGFQVGNVRHNVIAKPLLMLYASAKSGMNEGIYFSSSECHAETIRHSTHFGFCDWPYYPFGRLRNERHVPGETFGKVVDFFDRHIKHAHRRAPKARQA